MRPRCGAMNAEKTAVVQSEMVVFAGRDWNGRQEWETARRANFSRGSARFRERTPVGEPVRSQRFAPDGLQTKSQTQRQACGSPSLTISIDETVPPSSSSRTDSSLQLSVLRRVPVAAGTGQSGAAFVLKQASSQSYQGDKTSKARDQGRARCPVQEL
ncbi:hypothetical protein PVAR5_6076 [Paecilomyces variotii No. 5]|uniref:Uncharacterized protein n=1 Tax=Byssochlamys spectabilis (strain No. 5 / NBRC 109023) TaxID=1356009 RepID=V5G5Z1_BYSSN|nr:hypothetical protein PVAR5_6076 [Paecilomyces variotii No. 5]